MKDYSYAVLAEVLAELGRKLKDAESSSDGFEYQLEQSEKVKGKYREMASGRDLLLRDKTKELDRERNETKAHAEAIHEIEKIIFSFEEGLASFKLHGVHRRKFTKLIKQARRVLDPFIDNHLNDKLRR